MCPFPIYPLYTRTVILSLDKPIADCFLFRPRKSREKRRKRSHTNVSSTLSTRSSTPPAQTPHVRFHERKWVRTRLCSKDRTQRLTRRNTGRFGRGRYYYPRSVPHVSETLRGQMSERQTLPFLGLGRVCSRRTQKAFGTAMRLCASLSRGVAAPAGCVIFSVSVEIAACTHSAFRERSHTRAHTPKQVAFWVGRYHYPRHELHVHEHPRAGCQNGKLCRFWVLVRRCSRRTQRACGTAMRLCASLFQGVAAPLGCVIFLQFGDVAVFSLCAQYFLNVRGRGVLLPSACFTCC